MDPSPNGSNGKDARGRFLPGNKGGPGNPHAKRVAKLRSMLLRELKPDDFKTICRELINMAKGGDLQAIKELLDRVIGKPVAQDVDAEIQELRELAEQLANRDH